MYLDQEQNALRTLDLYTDELRVFLKYLESPPFQLTVVCIIKKTIKTGPVLINTNKQNKEINQ